MHIFMYNVDFIGHFAFVIIENDLVDLTCQHIQDGIPGHFFCNFSFLTVELFLDTFVMGSNYVTCMNRVVFLGWIIFLTGV